jgi:hypothetical protein
MKKKYVGAGAVAIATKGWTTIACDTEVEHGRTEGRFFFTTTIILSYLHFTYLF